MFSRVFSRIVKNPIKASMQNANIYTELSKTTPKYSYLRKFLKDHEHLLRWSPGENILDVGCGPGDVTANVLLPWLPEDIRLLMGVDISPTMIKHAISNHVNDKVTFAIVDIGTNISDICDDNRFPNGFGKIFSFYVLHWLPDLRQGINNLFSLICPGGQALVMFPVNRLFQRTYKIVSSKDQWREYFKDIVRQIPSALSGADPNKEFQEMVSATGFKVNKCETNKISSYFDSVDLLKDLIESLDPHICCVPSELKNQYLNDCIQELEELKAVNLKTGSIALEQLILSSVITK